MIKEIFLLNAVSSAKFSVVVLLLLLFTKPMLKRYSAGFRYYAWLLVMIVFLIPFKALNISYNTDKIPAVTLVSQNASELLSNVVPSITVTDDAASIIYSRPLDAGKILAGFWAVGAGLYFFLHIFRYFKFKKAATRLSNAPTDSHISDILKEECLSLKLTAHPTVRISGLVNTPMLLGIFRPILLLPDASYDSRELGLIFRHELVHYKRKDILYQFILLVFLSLHWYNPVAHIMARSVEIDGETACDEKVLSGKAYDDRIFYGEMLINFLKLQNTKKSYMTTTFYGGKNAMKKRLLLIKNDKIKKTGKAAMCLLLIFTTLLSVTTAIAESEYFSLIFEGDTSYLTDFIKTPKQSISDGEFTLTLEQYLVSQDAAVLVYSTEHAQEDVYDGSKISFSPTVPDKVDFFGFTQKKLEGSFNTNTKTYYAITATNIVNPNCVDFTFGIRGGLENKKITVPMTPNIETVTKECGNVIVKQSPINMSVMYKERHFHLDEICEYSSGYQLYFKLSDGSIKTLGELYEENSGYTENGYAIVNYIAKRVIKPGEIKSIIVYDEKNLSCYEYRAGGGDKELALPDGLTPFMLTPYKKEVWQLPLRELCDKLAIKLYWNSNTHSAEFSYRDSDYTIPSDGNVFYKDGEAVDVTNQLYNDSMFIDECGRLIISTKILNYMNVACHGTGTAFHIVP